MLEILTLIFVWRRIGQIARGKGLSTLRYRAIAIGLWFLFEFGTGAIGLVLGTELPFIYLLSFIAAFCSLPISFHLAHRAPAKRPKSIAHLAPQSQIVEPKPQRARFSTILGLIIVLAAAGMGLVQLLVSFSGLGDAGGVVWLAGGGAIPLFYALLSPLSAKPVRSRHGLICLALAIVLHAAALGFIQKQLAGLQNKNLFAIDPEAVLPRSQSQARAQMLWGTLSLSLLVNAILCLYVVMRKKSLDTGGRLVEPIA
jgi:hypothetical protein